MATHFTVSSILKESLVEMFLVAEYSIEFRKDISVWGAGGCYGYPSAILLFSIADSIGSYAIGGNVRKHFNILNHEDYYNLKLNQPKIDMLYEKYRSLLIHNAVMANEATLSIGDKDSLVFELRESTPYLNLLPFLEKTRVALSNFLEVSDDIVNNSKQLRDILKK